jgi:hypothetical protein
MLKMIKKKIKTDQGLDKDDKKIIIARRVFCG